MHRDGVHGGGKGRDDACIDITDTEKQCDDSANGGSKPPLQPPQPPLQQQQQTLPPALVVTVVHHEATQKSSEAVDCFAQEKGYVSRTESSHEQCRVCQQDKEEILIDLGCLCRGELAKAHHSCIDTWFRTKGSNKCRICQQAAANVSPPESFPTTNYWVWRVDPSVRGSVITDQTRAYSILIGSLLLDVFISVTLGVSAWPINIIIGIIVVRLAVDFFQEWNMRRSVQRMRRNTNLRHHPAL